MTDLHDASQILDDWQGPPTLAAGTGTEPLARFHHYFERTVDVAPAAIALECDRRRLTYAELDALANRLANHLLTHVLRPGARVGVMIGRSSTCTWRCWPP